MTRLEWPRELQIAADPEAAAFAGGVTADHLTSLHSVLVPLLRTLLLMGYEVPGFAFRMPGGGPEWVRFDRYALTISQLPGPAPAPQAEVFDVQWGDGPTVAIDAIPMVDARDAVTTLAIPFNDGLHWQQDPGHDLVYLGYQDPSATLDRAGDAKDVMRALEDAARDCLDALVIDASDRLESVPWQTWQPESEVGLFWLLDSRWWRPDVLMGERTPSVAGRELEYFGAAVRARLELLPSVSGYFDEGLTGVRATPRAPQWFRRKQNLVNIIRLVIGEQIKAPYAVDLFFGQLRIWLREIGERDKLADHVIDELADASWFEVLVTLVDVGVFTPSPLGVMVFGPATLPDPVVVIRWSVDVVELTVLGQLSIWLRRVQTPEGVPIPQESEDTGNQASPVEDPALLAPIEEFTWDFLVPVDGSLPTLYLVAAPGVAIDIPTEPQPDGWRYEIVRVPDAALVPEWETAVDPHWLMPAYVVSPTDTVEAFIELDADESSTQAVAAAVAVVSTPRGVVLGYPVFDTGAGDPVLSVEVTLDDTAARSGDERYATDIFFYQDERFPQPMPYLSVWATPGVTVRVNRIINQLLDLDPFTQLTCHVWTVPDYTDVPAFGVPLPFDPATVEGFPFADGSPVYLPDWPEIPTDLPLPAGRFQPREVEHWALPWWVPLCVDLVIGAIPVVGDVLDAAQFLQAVTTGTDRWGRPVDNLDLLLLGTAVITPFVSSPMVTGMRRGTAELFGGARGKLTDLPVAAPGTWDNTLVMAQKSVEWPSLDDLERQLAREELVLLSRTPMLDYSRILVDEFARPSDLLKAAERVDSRMPNSSELLRAYRHWAEGEKKKGKPQAFRAFIESGRTVLKGRVRAIIETICGNDVSVGTESRRKPTAAKKWKSIPAGIRANPPAPDYLRTHLPGLLAEVERYVSSRPRPTLWVDQNRLELSDALLDAGVATEYVARVRSLLASLSCGAGPESLTLDQLSYLIGNKRLYLGELALILVVGIDLLKHDLAAMQASIDQVLPQIGGAARPLSGLHKFFNAAATGAAPENSARFEMIMVGQELRRGVAPRMLRTGSMLPGVADEDATQREGPDLLRYRTEAGSVVADVLQGKSFKSIKSLFATDKTQGEWFRPPPPGQPVKPSKKPWKGPELFAQMASDLIRLAQADPPYWVIGPDTDQTVDCPDPEKAPPKVPFSGEIEFYFDFAYYYRNRNPWRLVPPTPQYLARLKQLADLRISQLRKLSDDELRLYLDDLRAVHDAEVISELLAEVVAPLFASQLQIYLNEFGHLPYEDGGLALPEALHVELNVMII